MIRSFAVALVIAALVSSSRAQEEPYLLRVTQEQLVVIWNALHKAPMPREVTDAAVSEIQKQVAAQKASREKAGKEAPGHH